jgi:hypothetical protein
LITSAGWFQLTGYDAFHWTTGRNRQNWDAMDSVSQESWWQRARGEREFIPSPNHHNHEEVQTVVLPMPAPEHPVETITIDNPQIIPAAALQMAKRLTKHGWKFDVRYCVGPWKKKSETVPILEQDEDGEWIETGSVEKASYGQAPSVVLRFRRNGQVGYAMWLAKPWTKDGDKMKFHAAQVRPGIGLLKSNELIGVITAPRADAITRPDEGGNNE